MIQTGIFHGKWGKNSKHFISTKAAVDETTMEMAWRWCNGRKCSTQQQQLEHKIEKMLKYKFFIFIS